MLVPQQFEGLLDKLLEALQVPILEIIGEFLSEPADDVLAGYLTLLFLHL